MAVDAAPSFVSQVLKFGALPLTIVSLLLTLMSYGHITGYLEAFRTHPEHLQLSAIDYLLRSYRPLFASFVALTEASTFEALMLWTERVWWLLWPAQMGITVLYVILVYIGANDMSMKALRNRLFTLPVNWSRAARARLLAYSAPLASIVIVIFGIVLAAMSTWALATAALFVVFVIPATSVTSGLAEARESVIAPSRCRAPGIENKRSVDGARCVRITRDGKEIARGRFVEQGPNRILLYRKNQDSLLSAPLDASIVEDVASE